MIQNCGDYWTCLHCSKTAKTKQHIKYHAESHLAVEHPCSYCGKTFRTSHSLSNHMSRYHKVQQRRLRGSFIHRVYYVCVLYLKKDGQLRVVVVSSLNVSCTRRGRRHRLRLGDSVTETLIRQAVLSSLRPHTKATPWRQKRAQQGRGKLLVKYLFRYDKVNLLGVQCRVQYRIQRKYIDDDL